MPRAQTPSQATTYRDKFRAATLGSNKTRRWKVEEIDLGDGEPKKVVIQIPGLRASEAAQETAGMTFESRGLRPDGSPDLRPQLKYPLRYSVEMVIQCCFEPVFGPSGEVSGVGPRIFEESDRDALMQEAMSGWLKALSDTVSEFINEKKEEASKNSEATPADSSSSR